MDFLKNMAKPLQFAIAFVIVGLWFLITEGLDFIGLSGHLTDLSQRSDYDVPTGKYITMTAEIGAGPYRTVSHYRRRGRTHRDYYFLVPAGKEKSKFISVKVEDSEDIPFRQLVTNYKMLTGQYDGFESDLADGTASLEMGDPVIITGKVKALSGSEKSDLEEYLSGVNGAVTDYYVPYCIVYETRGSAKFGAILGFVFFLIGLVVGAIYLFAGGGISFGSKSASASAMREQHFMDSVQSSGSGSYGSGGSSGSYSGNSSGSYSSSNQSFASAASSMGYVTKAGTFGRTTPVEPKPNVPAQPTTGDLDDDFDRWMREQDQNNNF